MKFRNTWVLLIVAILFGAYIYFIEIKKVAQDEEKKTEAEKVFTLDKDKIKSIAIKNSRGEVHLEKTGDKTWQLTTPVKDAADTMSVTSTLSALANEKYDQDVEGEDLKTFGLDNPKVTATFTTQDGKTEKIDVGIDSPLPGKVYIERDGDKKALFADAAVKNQLDKTVDDFRDKKIFRKSKDDVKAVSLKYNTKENHSVINLEKKDNRWMLNGDHSADAEAVSGLLNSIDSLKATNFPSERGDDKAELKKYGLNKPEMVFQLSDKDKKPLAEIDVSSKKDNNIYMKIADNPTIFQTFVGVETQLLHKPQDFRDKKGPFEFKKDDVKEILIKTSLVDWHLLKKAASWELEPSNSKKQPDQIQIENFIDRVSNMRVSEFADGEKPKGLDSPEGRIIFRDSAGKEVFNLAWGDKTKSGKSVFVKTDKSPMAVAVDASSIQTLPTQALVADVKPPSPPAVGSAGGPAEKTPPKPPLPQAGHS